MLWESVDPRQELTNRFGFRDGVAAAEWVADVLEQHWSLDVVRCDRLVVEGDLLAVDDPGHVDEAGRMLATLHRALATYPGQVGRSDRRAHTQLVHDDFRSANILHDGTRISAVLDFERITYDTRVADIAKSAVLLATRYRDWGPTDESVRTAYLSAYDEQAHDPLTTSERHEFDARVAALLKTFGWA
jgi:homoserine kinase type II